MKENNVAYIDGANLHKKEKAPATDETVEGSFSW